MNIMIDEKEKQEKYALHVAAENGDLTEVKRLVEECNADVNEKDSCGYTPLHEASSNGHAKVVKYLIANNARVNKKNNKDSIPLHLASLNGHIRIVQYLIQNGAKIQAEDMQKSTALYLAVAGGHTEVIKCLIANNAKVNIRGNYATTPLHLASINGHIKIVCCLVKANANIEAKDVYGSTPLHYAAAGKNIGVVQYLIANKANIGAKDMYNASPLHYISGNNKFEAIEYLIANRDNSNKLDNDSSVNLKITQCLVTNNININEKDFLGFAPLHYAAESGYIKIVKFLIKNNAYVDVRSNSNATPMHSAAFKGHFKIVKCLISNNANIEAMDNDNISILHLSSMYGHIRIVEYLVQNKSKVNVKEKYDCGTPLHAASTNGHVEVAKYLINNNANLETEDADGNTALHCSISKGCKITKYLIDGNAKINAKNKSNMTALHYAIGRGYEATAKYLITNGANINAKTNYDKTPLDYAIASGFLSIVQCLIGMGMQFDNMERIRNFKVTVKRTEEVFLWLVNFHCKSQNSNYIIKFMDSALKIIEKNRPMSGCKDRFEKYDLWGLCEAVLEFLNYKMPKLNILINTEHEKAIEELRVNYKRQLNNMQDDHNKYLTITATIYHWLEKYLSKHSCLHIFEYYFDNNAPMSRVSILNVFNNIAQKKKEQKKGEEELIISLNCNGDWEKQLSTMQEQVNNNVNIPWKIVCSEQTKHKQYIIQHTKIPSKKITITKKLGNKISISTAEDNVDRIMINIIIARTIAHAKYLDVNIIKINCSKEFSEQNKLFQHLCKSLQDAGLQIHPICRSRHLIEWP